MAGHRNHPHPVTPAPGRGRRLMRAAARRLRRAEGAVERHWPFAAYALATLATTAYIVHQLARMA